MFKKKQRLKKELDFKKIFSLGRFVNDGVISLGRVTNGLGFNRWAIVVSSGVLKLAVKRNLIRRRLINIFQNIKTVNQGFDIIVIVKNKNIIQEKNSDLVKRANSALSKLQNLSCR